MVKQEVGGAVAPSIPAAADANGAAVEVKSEPAAAAADAGGDISLEADEKLVNLSPPPAEIEAAAAGEAAAAEAAAVRLPTPPTAAAAPAVDDAGAAPMEQG